MRRNRSVPAQRRRPGLRWCRGRRLVVVDLENVVGGPCDTADKVRWARQRLVDVGVLSSEDLVVVGVDQGALVCAGLAWKGPRHVPGYGESGADKALLDVLGEDVGRRFEEIVLVSGDGIFARTVARLTANGVRVTVVAHEVGLSLRLRMAAARVVLLSSAPGAPLSPGQRTPRSA
jgi:hypothetical protein